MKRGAMAVWAAAVLFCAAAQAQVVDRFLIQYEHPLLGLGQSGVFFCDDALRVSDEEAMQVTVYCDDTGYDCSQNLWYEVQSGDLTPYTGFSPTGAIEFNFVQTNAAVDLFRARICEEGNCAGGVGPWCDLAIQVWDMPGQFCDYLLSRIYNDCFLLVRDESGDPLTFGEAAASCDDFGDGWECLEDCMTVDDSCASFSACIDTCFPADPGDDDDSADDDDMADDDDSTDDDDSADDDDSTDDDDAGDDDSDGDPPAERESGDDDDGGSCGG